MQPLVEQLYGDLAQKGLTFRPPCFVGDEWFRARWASRRLRFRFLVRRLRELGAEAGLEVEGIRSGDFSGSSATKAATAYAFMACRLPRRKKWQAQFGLSSNEDTPSTYRPRPYRPGRL